VKGVIKPESIGIDPKSDLGGKDKYQGEAHDWNVFSGYRNGKPLLHHMREQIA
jgi:hypothetical protein